MCFVWIWEQTAIISPYNINGLVFTTEMECVYCTVWTGSLYTASLTFSNSTFCPHTVFMCFVWIWEQTAIISPYNINGLVFTTEMECVYCEVRTGSLYTASLTFSNSTFCQHSVFMCFVWIWEQTAIISPYNINWLVCITETECVYCVVRTVVSICYWDQSSVFLILETSERSPEMSLWWRRPSPTLCTVRSPALRSVCSPWKSPNAPSQNAILYAFCIPGLRTQSTCHTPQIKTKVVI